MEPQGGGTVYGKGGVDARPPRSSAVRRFGGVHPGVTAAVASGMVLAFALGWFVWQSNSEQDTLRDLSETAAEQPVVSVPAGPAASPSAEAPVTLAAGPRKLESVKSPGSFVSPADDLAVITASGQALQVTPGLADSACFSFHTDDDRYLRHFDYRLRFDADDDSALFREDATFCPEDGAEPGSVTLRSHNYPGHVVHHRNIELWIDEPDGSPTFAQSSSFTIHEG